MKTKLYAEVIEDNGGDLTRDINNLCNGDDPRSDWDNGEENPEGIYRELMMSDFSTWRIVAEVYDGETHIYPDNMGRAAKREFGID